MSWFRHPWGLVENPSDPWTHSAKRLEVWIGSGADSGRIAQLFTDPVGSNVGNHGKCVVSRDVCPSLAIGGNTLAPLQDEAGGVCGVCGGVVFASQNLQSYPDALNTFANTYVMPVSGSHKAGYLPNNSDAWHYVPLPSNVGASGETWAEGGAATSPDLSASREIRVIWPRFFQNTSSIFGEYTRNADSPRFAAPVVGCPSWEYIGKNLTFTRSALPVPLPVSGNGWTYSNTVQTPSGYYVDVGSGVSGFGQLPTPGSNWEFVAYGDSGPVPSANFTAEWIGYGPASDDDKTGEMKVFAASVASWF